MSEAKVSETSTLAGGRPAKPSKDWCPDACETQGVVVNLGGARESAPDSLSILDRTSRRGGVERDGIASSDACPRSGSIRLTTRSGRKVEMETRCKTWRCKGCRDRMIGLFVLRVETGCSILGRCAFITVTYKVDERLREDVESVKRDWTAFSREFLRPNNLKWLRVTELTKRGMPHHHLVTGTLGEEEQVSCYGSRLLIRRYLERFNSCACLSHRAARAWKAITGSYIVHAIEVSGAKGAGRYMGKYLHKTFLDPVFTRRWATSHGWPGAGKLQLKQTMEGGWEKREFWYGKFEHGAHYSSRELEERGGPQWALDRLEARNKKRMMREIVRRLKND